MLRMAKLGALRGLYFLLTDERPREYVRERYEGIKSILFRRKQNFEEGIIVWHKKITGDRGPEFQHTWYSKILGSEHLEDAERAEYERELIRMYS
mmetsp:Transcript_18499/g.28408  ORF Transcript_18499/g.28408 Transcript_18499/m.28408 type:complete len:95 (+) Transcript_18499:1544-1828(+)